MINSFRFRLTLWYLLFFSVLFGLFSLLLHGVLARSLEHRLDEALAVGDIAFHQRCMRKIHDLRARGTTILFVSHEAGDVKALCERCLWLEAGRMRMIGETDAWVLSDEVYSQMVYDGAFASIATEPGMFERTILLDGCSKTFAMTGWRCGFAAVPEPLVDPLVRFFTNSPSCVPPFV